jgi:hypothetical protein
MSQKNHNNCNNNNNSHRSVGLEIDAIGNRLCDFCSELLFKQNSRIYPVPFANIASLLQIISTSARLEVCSVSLRESFSYLTSSAKLS